MRRECLIRDNLERTEQAGRAENLRQEISATIAGYDMKQENLENQAVENQEPDNSSSISDISDADCSNSSSNSTSSDDFAKKLKFLENTVFKLMKKVISSLILITIQSPYLLKISFISM